jgi:ribosome recycling factor
MLKFVLNETNSKEFEKVLDAEMDKSVKHFEKELLAIRTGRAYSGLLDSVRVPCYGGKLMQIREIGSISCPDARTIVIQPWDTTIMADIEKALLASDVGAAPINDGNVIRIRLPEMSGSRREDLVKVLHKKAEEGKITIRNVRKEFHNLIRSAEKAREVSEDQSKRLDTLLQKITDKHITVISNLAEKKEADIRTV